MKVGIIVGSHRQNSQSQRVASYVTALNQKGRFFTDVFTYSLAGNPLPLWDEGVWEGKEPWPTIWGPVSQELQSCAAFIIVTPEWSGMVPAGLKNFFLFCSPKDVGHKPALIVSVSSGMGGAYPVAELRMSSYKNTHICFLPEHIIVRKVEDFFKSETPQPGDETLVVNRIKNHLGILKEYASALAKVRDSGVIDYKNFLYGM